MPDGGFTAAHRAPIILAAARNKVPAVYAASYCTMPETAVCSPMDPTL
jgi:hypothetical protein